MHKANDDNDDNDDNNNDDDGGVVVVVAVAIVVDFDVVLELFSLMLIHGCVATDIYTYFEKYAYAMQGFQLSIETVLHETTSALTAPRHTVTKKTSVKCIDSIITGHICPIL